MHAGKMNTCWLVLWLVLFTKVLRHIQVLDFSHNHIGTVGRESFETASGWEASLARTINLSFCNVSSIEDNSITTIPNIQDLDLSGNGGISTEMLTNLIKELETGARNLDRLSLASMNLTTIVPFFNQVSEMSLKFLNISFNSINNVPASVFSTISSLRELDISRNSITTFPQGLSDLVNLRVLNISYNNIDTFFGDAVDQLSNLHTLDVSHNKFTDSNRVNFSPLANLKYLKVNNNFLASVILPGNTSNLQYLDYHSNRIKEFSGVDNAGLLEIVDLSDNDIESVPGSLFRDVKVIKFVNFSKNSIKVIDNRAFLPRSPSTIDLSYNFLKEVLYSNWEATQKLNLNNNKIVLIENQAFRGMMNLEILDLSKNGLFILHDDVFHYLRKLKYLNLSYNGLSSVQWLRNEQLSVLDLGHNNISHLEESMLFFLPKIQELYLQTNQLKIIIPRTFRDATELKMIDLSNNPFDCVCDMLAFKDWLQRTKISITGLYLMNSTAYHCHGPQRRVGIHVLHWDEERFECNRSMLYLVIILSTGVFFTVVGVVASALYRLYKKRKLQAEIKRKLKEEEEERKKLEKHMEIVKLSNREIAEAIKEAMERKNSHQRYMGMDRYRFRYPHRLSEQYRDRRISESTDKHKDKIYPGRKESQADSLNGRRQSEASTFNPYYYDRRLIPLRKMSYRYEDLIRESRARDHDNAFYYTRDPRYKEILGFPRRNSPYFISPANIIPNRSESGEMWYYPRDEMYRGYRRSSSVDHRMDGYMSEPIREDGYRQWREARAREKLDGQNNEYIHNFHDEGGNVYNQHRVDSYYPYYDHRRSQSYNVLPQDYTTKMLYAKRARAQRPYDSLEPTCRDSGIGPRATSQPILSAEATSNIL